MYHIYELVNSKTQEPFYIGWTKNLVQRLGGHIKDSVRKRANDKDRYIEDLILSGGFPIMKSIKIVQTKDEANLEEVELIKEYKKFYKLYNSTEGGKGTKGLSRPSLLKKAVCKIDMKTLKVIEIYDSIMIAAKQNSLHASGINQCCLRKGYSTGKFFWSFESKIKEFVPLEAIKKGHNRKRKVIQMSLDGKEIACFDTMTAATITGANITKISDVCNGKRNTAGGFKWKYRD